MRTEPERSWNRFWLNPRGWADRRGWRWDAGSSRASQGVCLRPRHSSWPTRDTACSQEWAVALAAVTAHADRRYKTSVSTAHCRRLAGPLVGKGARPSSPPQEQAAMEAVGREERATEAVTSSPVKRQVPA